MINTFYVHQHSSSSFQYLKPGTRVGPDVQNDVAQAFLDAPEPTQEYHFSPDEVAAGVPLQLHERTDQQWILKMAQDLVGRVDRIFSECSKNDDSPYDADPTPGQYSQEVLREFVDEGWTVSQRVEASVTPGDEQMAWHQIDTSPNQGTCHDYLYMQRDGENYQV